MKHMVPVLFLFMGGLFLLVSTVLYPAITTWLTGVQGDIVSSAPPFWDLPLVLRAVRVIFLVVGVFLILFGIAAFWLKERWS